MERTNLRNPEPGSPEVCNIVDLTLSQPVDSNDQFPALVEGETKDALLNRVLKSQSNPPCPEIISLDSESETKEGLKKGFRKNPITASKEECKSTGSPPECEPSLLANYKTPHSQRRAQQRKKKQALQSTSTCATLSSDKNGKDVLRKIPDPIINWSACVDVWLNIVYKEEASLRTRNTRMSAEMIASRSTTFLPRMRAILVDWIMEVCEVYHQHRNTYYLALDYIDRFLSVRPQVPKTQLQLLGVTCLFVASKLEEIYPPKLSEFAYVCDGACTVDEILTCEVLVLSTLSWDLNPMTPTGWLNLYMQIHSDAQHSTTTNTTTRPRPRPRAPLHEHTDNSPHPSAANSAAFHFPAYSAYQFVRASHIMDLFSLDPCFIRFSYSVIAAAAMHLVCGDGVALAVSGLDWEQIELCVAYMSVFYKVLCDSENPRLICVQGNGSCCGSCGTNDSPAANGTVDERQMASYRAIRANVPNLVRDENHSMQTHCVDLDYFEKAVLLRLEWLGFSVTKIYRKSKQPTKPDPNDDDDDDNNNPEDEPPSTIVMYQLERVDSDFVNQSPPTSDTESTTPPSPPPPPPPPPTKDNSSIVAKSAKEEEDAKERNRVNVFTLAPKCKLVVNFDEILASVYRDCTDTMYMRKFETVRHVVQ